MKFWIAIASFIPAVARRMPLKKIKVQNGSFSVSIQSKAGCQVPQIL